MNSAQRLENLFIQLRTVAPQTSVANTPPSGVDAWSTLLGRHGPAGQDLDDVAAECALAVNQEVSHLGNLLNERAVPKELYQHHLAQLKAVTSTRHLHGYWQDIVMIIREEQIVMLQWAGYVLGDDGSSDIAEEVERLADEINQLIAEVERSQLQSSLRMFVLRNLRSVRDALWSYKVSGADSLRSAMQMINGTSERELATLRPVTEGLREPERNIMQRVGQAIGAVANACDIASKIQGGYALGATAAAALGLTG
jgi:hypothetical protein